ncbi:ABC transporter permease [Aeromicrobium alkaliterrae]|uniref:Autoinducer 2 import system permease protein LsrD n=1 Tax=Aeromicrobium alkaliterrae TaxID=302168 RepID=A0ABN2JQS4_9ACTN
MSTTTRPASDAGERRGLPAHSRSLGARLAAGAATPGGAVYVLVVVLLVSIIISNPNFGEPGALIRFAGRTAPIAIAAMGQYYVIVSGEFDLSMGAVVTTQVVIAGNLAGDDSGQVVPVLVLMLVVGALIGLVNGLLTTLLRVPSFIVTLGTMLALFGLLRYVAGVAPAGNPVDEFREIGRGGFEDVPVVEVVPYPLIIVVVLATLAAFSMRRPFGRSLVAVGDNPEAARLGGTSVWWVKTRAFIISSLSATVAGIILVGYAGGRAVGQGYEFSAITAVVVGGVLLGGGRGWVLSAAAGAYALELLFVLLTVLDVPSTWRDSVQGLIIIVAVAASARVWQVGRRSGAPPPTSEPDSSTPTPPTPGTHQGEQP